MTPWSSSETTSPSCHLYFPLSSPNTTPTMTMMTTTTTTRGLWSKNSARRSCSTIATLAAGANTKMPTSEKFWFHLEFIARRPCAHRVGGDEMVPLCSYSLDCCIVTHLVDFIVVSLDQSNIPVDADIASHLLRGESTKCCTCIIRAITPYISMHYQSSSH